MTGIRGELWTWRKLCASASLEETSVVRFASAIVIPPGYNPPHHKGPEASYHYRMHAELRLNETSYGAIPYPPAWAGQDE